MFVVCKITKLPFLSFRTGTDLDANTKSKSDKYAKKMGLPEYDYVLHPRVTGFTFLVDELRKRKWVIPSGWVTKCDIGLYH